MNQRICVSKKITYAFMFSLFVLLFVLLGELTLQSNQAKNSRAAVPTGVPIALPSPLAAPNCYAPIPKHTCLKPTYIGGVKSLELQIESDSIDFLNTMLVNSDWFAVYRINDFNGIQTPTHLTTLSSPQLGAIISATGKQKFVYENVSLTKKELSSSKYVVFGISSSTMSLADCGRSTFVPECK